MSSSRVHKYVAEVCLWLAILGIERLSRCVWIPAGLSPAPGVLRRFEIALLDLRPLGFDCFWFRWHLVTSLVPVSSFRPSRLLSSLYLLACKPGPRDTMLKERLRLTPESERDALAEA
jgi:hypothetical protein